MPWKSVDGGYTTKRGGFVRNPAQYEKLKAKYGKQRAAAITNASNFRHPVSKGRTAGGARRQKYGASGEWRPGPESMQHRGGPGYYQPSPEQVAAAKARRAQQSAYRLNRSDRLRGAGKKVSLAEHWRSAGDLPGRALLAAGLGTGLLVAGDRINRKTNNKIGKADTERRTRQVAAGTAGAAGGGLLTSAGLHVGGQTAKATLKSRRASRGQSLNQARIWRRHLRQYPVNSHNDLVRRFSNYPKSLPDWRGQRLLAFKNRPAVSGTAIAAGAGLGAAYVLRRGHKPVSKTWTPQDREKYDKSRRRGIAEAVGGSSAAFAGMNGAQLLEHTATRAKHYSKEARRLNRNGFAVEHMFDPKNRAVQVVDEEHPLPMSSSKEVVPWRDQGIRPAFDRNKMTARRLAAGAYSEANRARKLARRYGKGTLGLLGGSVVGMAGGTVLARRGIKRIKEANKFKQQANRKPVSKTWTDTDRKKYGKHRTAEAAGIAAGGVGLGASGAFRSRRAVRSQREARAVRDAVGAQWHANNKANALDTKKLRLIYHRDLKPNMTFEDRDRYLRGKSRVYREGSDRVTSRLHTNTGHRKKFKEATRAIRTGISRQKVGRGMLAGGLVTAGIAAPLVAASRRRRRVEKLFRTKRTDEQGRQLAELKQQKLDTRRAMDNARLSAFHEAGVKHQRENPRLTAVGQGAGMVPGGTTIATAINLPKQGSQLIGLRTHMRSPQGRHLKTQYHQANERYRQGKRELRVQKSYGVLIPIEKADKDTFKRDSTGGAAVASGALVGTLGAAGGGLPGVKANRIMVDVKSAKTRKAKAANLARAYRGGEFGYRQNAHHTFKTFGMTPPAVTPNSTRKEYFQRGQKLGGKSSETHILRHLKVGRRASNAALIGGTGLAVYGAHRMRQKQVAKAQNDRDSDHFARVGGALAGGGTTVAAGSYGGSRLLEHQGRAWSHRAARQISDAQKIASKAGGYKLRTDPRFNPNPRVPDVVPEVASIKIANKHKEILAGKTRAQAERVGRLRGGAAQSRYFAGTYGKLARVIRRGSKPGIATAAAGGGVLLAAHHHDKVGKSAFRHQLLSTTKDIGVAGAGGVVGSIGMNQLTKHERNKLLRQQHKAVAKAQKPPMTYERRKQKMHNATVGAGIGAGLTAFPFALQRYENKRSFPRGKTVGDEIKTIGRSVAHPRHLPSAIWQNDRGAGAVLNAGLAAASTGVALHHHHKLKQMEETSKSYWQVPVMVQAGGFTQTEDSISKGFPDSADVHIKGVLRPVKVRRGR